MAIVATMLAMSVPAGTATLGLLRLSSAAREVERELHGARMRAVSSNRIMRVRFNCPAAGQYRMVEFVGLTAIDNATNRCDPTAYPFPAADDDPLTRPNLDGPVRRVPAVMAVTGPHLEFAPDGSVRQVVSGTAQPVGSSVTVSVVHGSATRSVTINGLGRIQMQ